MEPVRLAAVGLGRWGHVLAGAYSRSPKVRLVKTYYQPDPIQEETLETVVGFLNQHVRDRAKEPA